MCDVAPNVGCSRPRLAARPPRAVAEELVLQPPEHFGLRGHGLTDGFFRPAAEMVPSHGLNHTLARIATAPRSKSSRSQAMRY